VIYKEMTWKLIMLFNYIKKGGHKWLLYHNQLQIVVLPDLINPQITLHS
jgi:hypothetical protein